jgi:hypothetical protein
LAMGTRAMLAVIVAGSAVIVLVGLVLGWRAGSTSTRVVR